MNWQTPALSALSCWVGSGLALLGLPGLLAPASWRKALAGFPRNVVMGWILAGVAIGWVSLIVLNASLGRFNGLKPAVYVLGPICFFLLVKYLDELLAARALGGLLLLLPDPMLDAARWHPSNGRYVVIVLAYIFAVAGMMLVLGPYRFRRWASWWIETNGRTRFCGLLKLALGGTLIFLGTSLF